MSSGKFSGWPGALRLRLDRQRLVEQLEAIERDVLFDLVVEALARIRHGHATLGGARLEEASAHRLVVRALRPRAHDGRDHDDNEHHCCSDARPEIPRSPASRLRDTSLFDTRLCRSLGLGHGAAVVVVSMAVSLGLPVEPACDSVVPGEVPQL